MSESSTTSDRRPSDPELFEEFLRMDNLGSELRVGISKRNFRSNSATNSPVVKRD